MFLSQAMPASPDLLATVASYVPGLIQRRLAADPAPRAQPAAEGFEAAVLFADISGFTALAERLAQQGPEGAEELTGLLNTYFGQLIDLISAHGGDVVKLAGDALVALWTTPGAPLPEPASLQIATQRAAQCGLAIQKALNAFDVGDGVRLQLRVGVGAGNVFMAHIGGQFGRWEFLLAGTPLAEVSLTQKQAAPGEVVLSHSAWALIRDETNAEPLDGGGARLEAMTVPLPLAPVRRASVPSEAERALRAYIPGAILDRISAGQTSWLAELRRVTVIFLNLPDLNHTTPLERAQATMVALQNNLYRYEGSINKLSVDDKGVTLVAALGLPPFAHEDDPSRGVHAALDMQTILRKLGLRSSIGVTTGRAFCGSVGNNTRREYTMIGDIVNVAARLMQAAPDTVLCDQTTFLASQTQVIYETLPPLALKGKAEPLPVYRARAEARTLLRAQTAIVGRETERRLLADGIQELMRGSGGRLIIIEGEAGIGKSRLVDDLRRQADTMRVATLSGLGDAVEKSTTYFAWRGVFNQLFDLSLLTDPDARRRHIEDLLELEPEIARLAPLLDPVLEISLPDNTVTAQMDGAVRADNTRDLMVLCLQQSVTRSPKVLILEDAHWLDSASWALALQVALRVRPLLVIIATRPIAEPTSEFVQLTQLAGVQRLKLDTLSLADTRVLVCQRLGVGAIPGPVLSLVRDKAEGNPFFTEELAYALRDSGLLTIADGECALAPAAGDLQALGFPDTVQGIITSRIDRLTPQQQLTLKAASVIGRVFAFRTLHDIHPIAADRPHLPAQLDTLRQLDITPLQTPEPDLAYLFKHVITWEVAYNLMLFAQRRELHKAVAEWYERTYAHELALYFELLAHHWAKAEEAPKAVAYAAHAGEQALRNGAYHEAVRFLESALELIEENPAARPPAIEIARWERELGQALNGLGHLPEARRHLERAAGLAGWPAPRTLAATLAGTFKQALLQTAHRLFPARYLGRARDRERVLEAARIYDLLAVIHYLSNHTLPTVHATLQTVNVAELAGPSLELARAYANICTAAGVVPLHSLAEGYRRRAYDIAEAVDLPSARVWVLFATSFYSLGVGRWQEARDALLRVVDLADQLGDHRQWAEASILLEQIRYYQGDFLGGARLAADLVTVASHSGNQLHRAWGLAGQAENALRLGLADQAIRWLDEAVALLAQNTDRTTEITAWGLRSLAHLHAENFDQAQREAAHAMKLAGESSPTSHYLFDGFSAPAEVFLGLWERGQAEKKAGGERQQLQRAARKAVHGLWGFAATFPIGAARAAYCDGWFQQLRNNSSAARRIWRQGLAAAERLAMPYDQALLCLALGRATPRGNPERTVLLEQACRIFEQLGVGAARDQAQRLLAQP